MPRKICGERSSLRNSCQARRVGKRKFANGEKQQVLKIKPLHWRAAKVDCFFKQLDHKASKVKSRQSKQQTLPRVTGSWSTRPKPVGFDKDFFGFNASEPGSTATKDYSRK